MSAVLSLGTSFKADAFPTVKVSQASSSCSGWAGRSIRSAFMRMLTPFVLVLTGLLSLGVVCSCILTVGCCVSSDVPT